MSRLLLNVADVTCRSRVNGPGIRSVVWVQGCTIKCPGCFNPQTHEHEPRRLVDPAELGGWLCKIKDTDGTTISGGEPFEQADACEVLAATVSAAGRSVMVFTGYTCDQLRASALPAVHRFLASIDLLVAGPYVEHLQCAGPTWRASSNQTVHALSDCIRNKIPDASNIAPLVELTIHGNAVSSTGFPASEDRQWLDQILERAGSRNGSKAMGRR